MSVKVDKVQKEIIKTIEEKSVDGYRPRFKDIHDEIGCPKSTLSMKISDLRDKGLVTDKGWKDNESAYVLDSNVVVETDYRFERLINERLYVNLIQVAGFGGMLTFLDAFTSVLAYIAFMIGFTPAFGYTIYQLLSDEDFYQLNVEVRDVDE